MYLFKITSVNSVLLGVLLSITLGMLLFIVIDELLPRIKNTKDKKTVFIGVVIGVILLLIGVLLG